MYFYVYLIYMVVASSLYNRIFSKSGTQSGGGISDFQGERFMKLLQEKKAFLALVFANLIFQLGITYIVMEKAHPGSKKKDPKKTGKFEFAGLLFTQFVLILILAIVPMNMYLKIFVFSLFSALTGYIFSFLRALTDPAIIKSAVLATLSIFVTMFIAGGTLLAFGMKLGIWTLVALLVALTGLIIFSIISRFMGTYSAYSKMFATFGLVLFSLFIIYDTNTILQRNYYGDFVTASLDYYLDIINIFLDILSMERN